MKLKYGNVQAKPRPKNHVKTYAVIAVLLTKIRFYHTVKQTVKSRSGFAQYIGNNVFSFLFDFYKPVAPKKKPAYALPYLSVLPWVRANLSCPVLSHHPGVQVTFPCFSVEGDCLSVTPCNRAIGVRASDAW
jgi:hypothetical protein